MIKVVIQQTLAGVEAPDIADIINSQKHIAQARYFVRRQRNAPGGRAFKCGVIRRDRYGNFALQGTGLDWIHVSGRLSLRLLNVESSWVHIRGVGSKNSIVVG